MEFETPPVFYAACRYQVTTLKQCSSQRYSLKKPTGRCLNEERRPWIKKSFNNNKDIGRFASFEVDNLIAIYYLTLQRCDDASSVLITMDELIFLLVPAVILTPAFN